MQRKQITIREEQDEFVQNSNINFSAWIRDALDEYMEHHKEHHDDFTFSFEPDE